ncbi:MAG TPA: hypothetical protein VGZ26_04850, partial [Pirellulales bacterium]|nr:hypothetical protein [Pirellulales bacterium]
DLLTYLKAQPFRPFRIRMASGRTFDIHHPEMAKVGRRDLMVFKLAVDEPAIHDDWDAVSLLSIESISHLDTAVSQP